MSSLYKVWLETRAGFLLVAGVVLLPVAAGAVGAPLTPAQWQRALDGPLFILFGVAALALADAGVSPTVRARPALIYTLSLPVSRRSILLERALVGVVQGAVVIVTAIALLWVLSPSLRAVLTPGATLIYATLLLGGQFLFCGVRVFLSTLWGPAWSLAAALLLFQAAVITRINVRGLPDGHTLRQALDVLLPLWAPNPGVSLALCLTAAAALVLLALARVEHGDF